MLASDAAPPGTSAGVIPPTDTRAPTRSGSPLVHGCLLAIALSTACATSRATDLQTVEASVVERARLASLTLPPGDEVPEEVDALLSKPLSADDAVRVALLSNREARAALAAVGIARGEYVQAGLLPNPELDLELRAPGGPQPLQVDVGLEVSISQSILTPLRASVAEATLEAERLKATGLLLDLSWQARVAFYEVQAAQLRLSLRLNALQSQQASYATALELSKVGNLPALELANELAAVELARVQVAEAENALVDAREALNRRLGLSGPRTRWAITAQLPVPRAPVDTTDAEARVIKASLELLELERRQEAASRKVGLAKTEGALPHLAAGFHGERDADLWELGAHLAVGLPVFDRKQGRQLSAQSEFEALRAYAEAVATSLRATVRQTLNRLESASKRSLHYADRLVPARQQQLAQTLLQYNAMTLGVFQVLEVQRGVTQASLAQVDAMVDYWKAHAALDLLLAGRSTPLVMPGPVPSSTSAGNPQSGAH